MVAERSEWFERMAHSDPLTGLANARTFGACPRAGAGPGRPPGLGVSVAIFDVDDFTATTSGGHEVGDDVLRRVASVLAESVRLVDTVGRIGGDEFVLVAPGPRGGRRAAGPRRHRDARPGRRTDDLGLGRRRAVPGRRDRRGGAHRRCAEALARAKGEGAGTVAESEAVAEH